MNSGSLEREREREGEGETGKRESREGGSLGVRGSAGRATAAALRETRQVSSTWIRSVCFAL